jgi:acetyltransferase-like isoleucine patch superfamily enzyme
VSDSVLPLPEAERRSGGPPDSALVGASYRILKRLGKSRPVRILLKPLDEMLRARIRDTLLNDYLVYGDASRLTIDPSAIVNNALFNLSSGSIVIKEYACLSHSVTLVTGVHDFRKLNHDRQLAAPTAGRDIVVERGAWLSSNVTVLGPCTIGEHSVVGAGSVVNRDVPPLTFVAGVPAKYISMIEPG